MTVAIPADDPLTFVRGLRARGVNTSATLASQAPLDLGPKAVTWALRLSPHYYNTEDEIDRAVTEVIAALPAAG